MRHLRTVRQIHHLSQAQLARESDLEQTYISLLERGLRPATPEHVTRVAKALGVPETVLMAEAVTITADGRIVDAGAVDAVARRLCGEFEAAEPTREATTVQK